jgi:hypothetical protein
LRNGDRDHASFAVERFAKVATQNALCLSKGRFEVVVSFGKSYVHLGFIPQSS